VESIACSYFVPEASQAPRLAPPPARPLRPGNPQAPPGDPSERSGAAGNYAGNRSVLEPFDMTYETPPPRRTATGGDILRILFAVLLPPLGVFLQVGFGLQFWLNVLLTILGYLPGIVHALWVILSRR
jgi:uncharacterized membrane protein YqaE (UPF0057 family)